MRAPAFNAEPYTHGITGGIYRLPLLSPAPKNTIFALYATPLYLEN
jgi:hypothetical protein